MLERPHRSLGRVIELRITAQPEAIFEQAEHDQDAADLGYRRTALAVPDRTHQVLLCTAWVSPAGARRSRGGSRCWSTLFARRRRSKGCPGTGSYGGVYESPVRGERTGAYRPPGYSARRPWGGAGVETQRGAPPPGTGARGAVMYLSGWVRLGQAGSSADSIRRTRSPFGRAPMMERNGVPSLKTVSVGTDMTW